VYKATPEKEEIKTEAVQEEKKKVEDRSEEKVVTKPKSAPKKAEKVKITNKMDDLTRYSPVRTDLPELKSGDIIRVSYRVIEGGKERIQIFEGTVIALKHSGIQKTITVRKTSFGIAVERIFPLNSKLVQKIEIKRHSKVRRSKLYYLRNLKGKAARLKEIR
jgi:large subunit ribosomal protein L19